MPFLMVKINGDLYPIGWHAPGSTVNLSLDLKYPGQPRDQLGRWTSGGGGFSAFSGDSGSVSESTEVYVEDSVGESVREDIEYFFEGDEDDGPPWPQALQALEESGASVHVAKRSSEALPHLEGVDHAAGVYDPGSHRIAIAERMYPKGGDPGGYRHSVEKTLTHEIGHAWDAKHGHSTSNSFRAAYASDVNDYMASKKIDPYVFSRYVKGRHARDELFADLFTESVRGGLSDLELAPIFKRSWAYLEKQMPQ